MSMDRYSMDAPGVLTKIVQIIAQATTGAWTDMPAAVTEFRGLQAYRRKLDLRRYTRWRLGAALGTLGVSGAKLGLQYSIDGGTTWKAMDSGTTDAQSAIALAIDAGANATLGPTAWTSIKTEARIDDCLIRVVGSDGNGVVDPAFYFVLYELG